MKVTISHGWTDCTSYSRGGRGELRAIESQYVQGLVVTRWIHGRPDLWYVRLPWTSSGVEEPGFETIAEATEAALMKVEKYHRERLREVEEAKRAAGGE